LLAHVLVHEITHVLQGVVRHSGTGVMRAHWDAREYLDMAFSPLEFTGADAELIQSGLRRNQLRQECSHDPGPARALEGQIQGR
jgi:hypothetical protein